MPDAPTLLPLSKPKVDSIVWPWSAPEGTVFGGTLLEGGGFDSPPSFLREHYWDPPGNPSRGRGPSREGEGEGGGDHRMAWSILIGEVEKLQHRGGV